MKNEPRILSAEPPCRVDLVLDPERYSGLASTGGKRVWSGNLTPLPREDKEPLYLVAEDARLRPDKRRNVVTLRADGFDRAFFYDITAARVRTLLRLSARSPKPFCVWAPRFAEPSKPVPLAFEADHVADPDSKRLVLDALTQVQ